MKKKLLALSILFMHVYISASAQKNYKPGAITLLSGEQISGLIDYRNWEKNPKKIGFKKSETAISEELSINELLSFVIHGDDSYIRAIVWKDVQPVKPELLEDYKYPLVLDTVFLRTLVNA